MHVTDGPGQQSKWPPQATVIMMIETAQTPSLETSILYDAHLQMFAETHTCTPSLCVGVQAREGRLQ